MGKVWANWICTFFSSRFLQFLRGYIWKWAGDLPRGHLETTWGISSGVFKNDFLGEVPQAVSHHPRGNSPGHSFKYPRGNCKKRDIKICEFRLPIHSPILCAHAFFSAQANLYIILKNNYFEKFELLTMCLLSFRGLNCLELMVRKLMRS